MGKSDPLLLALLITVLTLAILTLVLAMSSGVLNGAPRELSFDSPAGRTQPEEGYVTPLYDPWTTVTVTVESDEPVQVLIYSSNFRGGKVFNNAENKSEIRDEFLVAGEAARRTGTNVVLSDFTTVSNQYMVDVTEPGTMVPSDADYTILIEARTTAITSLFYLSLLLMGLFAVIMVYRRSFSKGKGPVPKVEGPSYAGGYQQAQWSPPPLMPHRMPPPPPPAAPPPPPTMPPNMPPTMPPTMPPPTMPPQGPTGRQPRYQETPVVEWEQSAR